MKNELINISLSELSEKEGLSVRTQNVCEYSNLKDIYSISDYYLENGDFLKLRNCGQKSNLELINVCQKYEKIICQCGEEPIEDTPTNPIEDSIYILTKQKAVIINIIESLINELSVRSSNVLKKYLGSNLDLDLIGIKKILAISKTDLRNLRNIGEKSIEEICIFLNSSNRQIQILSSIDNQIANIKYVNKPNPFLNKINFLNTKQKTVINNIIEGKINSLTNRSRIALMSFLKNDLTLKNFEIRIFSETEFEIGFIQDIGDISKNELQSFLSTIKEQIEFISELNNFDIEFELFKAYIKLRFPIDENMIMEFIKDSATSKGLPVFKFIIGLIDNGIILNSRDKIIFYNEYCLIHKNLSTENIPIISGLTRERVRQIKIKFLQRFDNIFNFIAQPELKSLINYNIDLTCNKLEITDDLIDHINKSEKTNFNRLFITKIFATLYSDKYDLIGQLEQKNSIKNTNSDNWQECYIVDKKITSIIDFDKLIDDVKKRLTCRIEEDYELNFQSYLLNFIKTSDYGNLDLIAEIAEYIIFNEFDVCINTNECIAFTKNTKVQIIDYVYEALEKTKEPLTIYELYKIIETKYPGVTKSASSLRGICQGDQKLFFIGRSSTYGLKVWENDFSIKGGTIRDIAEEYLKNQAEPKHIDEITEYVNKYRNTNSKSIFANLHMDENKRFVFFGGMLIGITNKEYSTEKYLPVKELQRDRKTWEEMFMCLQKFVEDNDRIPYSTGSESETKLYRFMKFQLNKSNASEIVNTEISKIFELVSKYNYIKKERHTSSNLKESYSELREFVLKNERLPRANYKNEKILYRFFYRQRKLFMEQSIPKEFKEKFIEIANLLNHTI